MTWRSALVSLVLVLLWTVGACFMAVHRDIYTQQLLMILGFGAILTIFLVRFPTVFLASLALLWGGTYATMYFGAPAPDKAIVLGGIGWSLLALAPMVAMALWLKIKPLARGEMVIVYACVVIAIPWCVCIKAVIESSTGSLLEVQQRAYPQVYSWARQMPWWGPTVPEPPKLALAGDATSAPAADKAGAPPAEISQEQRVSLAAAEGFAIGNGGVVPWELWWRPIAFWTVTCLSFQAMLMGLLLLFRKRWIEHERLPFVWSQPALHIIGGDDGGNNRKRWLMFAIGLGLCLPAVLLMGSSGEPLSGFTILPWVGQEGIRGGFDLTELNLLPKTTLRLWWGPLVLAALLLFPVDVLMTTALTFILMNLLLPGLMRAMGLEVGPSRLGDFVRWGLRFGGCAGLLFWSCFFGLLDWIKSPARKAPPGAKSGKEDIPLWLVIALAGGGFVVFVALGCYSTTLVQMLLLTGFILVYAFSQVRQRIEGMPAIYDNNIGSHQMLSIQTHFLHDHYTLAVNDPNATVTPHSWATHWMQWGFAGQLKSFGPHNMLLEVFKIAHELRVHARTVGKVVLITMLIVAALTPALYVKLMYVYGFENSYSGSMNTWDSFTQWSRQGAGYGTKKSSGGVFFHPPPVKGYQAYRNIFNAVYGMLLIGLLFYLRREYPRFPLSPVGVVLGAEVFGGLEVPFSPTSIWFTFLVAWVVKSLIFRWLGVRSFREKVQPALIMVLCGMIFGLMAYLCRFIGLGVGSLR